jgi:hypothetical protein
MIITRTVRNAAYPKELFGAPPNKTRGRHVLPGMQRERVVNKDIAFVI